MENGAVKPKGTIKRSPEELFNKFIEAEDCPEILQTFQRLVNAVGVVAETPREFYHGLKSKLQSWKCKSLWELLDSRANQKEYLKGEVCEDIHSLVIGCGPIGLRVAIELALLGAQVVIVEKRKSFSRNNVLHLWPFLLTDFKSLGAKKFYGKFCSGSIDHISIRRLQAVLLKTALVLGVKVFTGLTFEKVIEPTNEDEGWKCHVTPFHDALSDFEVDVIIGADGKKNVLPGFAQIEMRGTLAIGITANFVNTFTDVETRVEEISGIAYQFNPGFFDRLKQQKGIQLENIVYYKDETHYFVMTAVKASLLKKGVLKKDYGNKPQKLLNKDNIDEENLTSYVNDSVCYATKGQLHNHEIKRDSNGKADIAVFDFTSIKKAENSARIIERKGHKLLLGLVGDSLLEPFWPTGSGCARGVLSALDAAWMVRAFAQDKPPLQILSERENIYRLLSGTSNENMHKNHATYTINPTSRYTHIPQKKIQEVYHLYDTDDPINADFSLGSPTGILATKGSRRKRVSTAAKPHYRSNRRHIKFAPHSSFESPFSSSFSSLEDIPLQVTRKKSKMDDSKTRQRTVSETLTSGGEEVQEITKASKWGKRSKKLSVKSPLSPSNHSSMSKSADRGEKVKSKKQKLASGGRGVASPSSSGAHHEKSHKRRSFFVFGRMRAKSRAGKKSPRHQSPRHVVEEKIQSTVESKVEFCQDDLISREASYQREVNSFSRNHPTRRSARDIIAEIEARNNNSTNVIQRKNSSLKSKDRSLQEITAKTDNKSTFKRTTSDTCLYSTPPAKHSKNADIWKDIESMSPCAKGAVPALSKMSPDHPKENDGITVDHTLHDVSCAMRIAGLMAMATPLLASDCRQPGFKGLPWNSKTPGRVKETINKYDSLTGRRWLAKDGTPLRAPNDRVDNADRKPTLVEVAQRIIEHQKADKTEQEVTPSWHATALAVVEGRTGPNTLDEQAKSRDQEMEKFRLLGKELSSLDQESTDSPVKKDFSSPIYQKTFISALNDRDTAAGNDDAIAGSHDNNTAEPRSTGTNGCDTNGTADLKNDKNDKHETPKRQLSVPRDYAHASDWCKSPALAKKEMDRLMLNLTETMSRERAETSIKFLISMFRRIQRNPKEDKFRRIFKSRVKFKKYVWTVRNAKMFLLASGWVEVGSFLLFPVEKNVRDPLSVLNKYLGLLATGSTVQISTIKSTPRRDSNKSRSGSTTSNETPRRVDSTKKVTPRPLDRQFSKSVPLNLENSGWDLEMEDPLEPVTVTQTKPRLVASALEFRAPRTPSTPDYAIIEEMEELSNTLDDLMETLEDIEQDQNVQKKVPEEKASSKQIDDLCTTIDYLLNSSEEEELDRDLNGLENQTKVVTSVPNMTSSTNVTQASNVTSTSKSSAFTKVVTPSNRQKQLLSESIASRKPVDKNHTDIQRSKSVPRGPKTVKPKVKTSNRNNSSRDEKRNEGKTRRKLPEEPNTKEMVPKTKSIDQTSADTSSVKGKGRFARQISQESLKLIQERFSNDRSVSTSKKTVNGNLKERPFTLNKKNVQQNRNKCSSESESIDKPTRHASDDNEKSHDASHQAPVLKSQSAAGATRKSGSKNSTKQNVNKKVNGKVDQANGSRAILRRESSNSISSIESFSSLPPSGLARTRSARARRRKEMSEKLECLETSYESLENSPKKSASRKSSSSSSTISVKDSQRKSSLREGRPSSISSRQSSTKGSRASSVSSQSSQDCQSTSIDTRTMRTRSHSATAKRTSSNAFTDRKKIDGLVQREPNPETKAAKPTRTNSLDTIRVSKPPSSAIERRSTKTKHRKLPSIKSASKDQSTSRALKVQGNENEVSSTSDKIADEKHQEKERIPTLNDSFDDVIVPQRNRLESASNELREQAVERCDTTNTDKTSVGSQAMDEQVVSTYDSAKKKQAVEDQAIGTNVSAKIKKAVADQAVDDRAIGTYESAKNELGIDEQDGGPVCAHEDLTVELKLDNTSSWMVLDYEGTNNTPLFTRKNIKSDMDDSLSLDQSITSDDNINIDNHDVMDSITDYDNHVTVDTRMTSSDQAPKVTSLDQVPKVTSLKQVPRVTSLDEEARLTSLDKVDHGAQTNGIVPTEIPLMGSDIVRRNALRKKKKKKHDLKSTIDSTNGKKSITFGKDEHVSVKSSSKHTGTSRKPFGLRRKNISESCPDINGSLATDSSVISDSLNISTPSLDKPTEKKKLSPFKLLAKKRKSADPRSLNNT